MHDCEHTRVKSRAIIGKIDTHIYRSIEEELTCMHVRSIAYPFVATTASLVWSTTARAFHLIRRPTISSFVSSFNTVKTTMNTRSSSHRPATIQQTNNDETPKPTSSPVSRGKKNKIDFSEFASNPVQMVPSTPMKSPNLLESNSFNTPVKQTMNDVIRTPKTNSSKKKKVAIEPGSLPPPKDWQDIYSLVEELRADQTAPVDSDGCQALASRCDPQVFRFQVLIALMLSSQTKDAVVGETIRHLQGYGLDVPTIHSISEETLNERICKVGFHNNKSRFIKQTVEILVRDYNGDIPGTAEELMNLPGVGPKMAYIVEQVAWGRCSGIGVDTHMHRLFQDLGWVKESSSPEKTREELQGWLPRDKWDQVNSLWVGFGQETQQQKEKVIRKALVCSKPSDALKLLKKVGVNVDKEAKKYGLDEDVKKAMKPSK